MAEAFEDRLYALIAEFEGEEQELIARFRARGGGALVHGDLDSHAYYDEEEVLDAVIVLMLEFGLTLPPEGDFTAQSKMFAKGVWDIRDITVGELKRAVGLGRWPEVWTYHKNTWWDHLRDLLLIPLSPVIAVAIMAFLPLLVCWQAGASVVKRLSRKPA